jgi:quinol monooxygenase YgiN
MERRTVVAGGLALALVGTDAAAKGRSGMYGMIGAITAKPGQGKALATILLEGTGGMPGCRAYIVGEDAANPDKLWIAETWDSKAAHEASLKLPQVQAAIGRGRPLIADFQTAAELKVLGDGAKG